MDLGLRGKVALITGGSSGIGLTIAQRFIEEGSAVAICGRDTGKLETSVAQLAELGGEVLGISAHVDRPNDILRLISETMERFERIDVVVSNAGTHLQGTIDDISALRVEEHFRTKVLGPWELARQVAPHMRAQGGGRFIVIIGQAGKVPGSNIIASAVTNAAQHAFVKSLSDHFGKDNILVNAVCPSRISSPLTQRLKLHNESYVGRSLSQQESGWGLEVPLGHWGTPEDIASAVIFLASEQAGFICGSNIDVDGGYQRSIL